MAKSRLNTVPLRDRRRPLALEVLEDRSLLSAQLILNGPQTLTPYANVNASNSPGVYQSEMTVAINPQNPLNVVGFSHHRNGISFNEISVYYSIDGGTSWTLTLIGGTGAVNSDGLGSSTNYTRFDPTVKFDANGNLFIAYCAYASGNSTRLVVAKSTNGGASFPNSDFRIIDSQPGYGGVDKVYLGTGQAGPSTTQQAVYVAYERALTGTPIMVAGSNDSGTTWTAPVTIDSYGGGSFYAGPAVGPNGELYVVWQSTGDSRIKFRAKPDGLWGGGSWDATRTVRILTDAMTQTSIPPQSRRGIYNTPVIDVDRSGGIHQGRIYVTFVDRIADFNTDVFLAYSDNGGVNWLPLGLTGNVESLDTSEFHSWVAVDQSSGSVSVLYKTNDGNPDPMTSTTRVASSFDGGATFPSKADIASQRSNAYFSTYAGEFLDYTGFDVHQGTMHGFWSDNRGATPGTYTADLEAYSAKAAFVSTTNGNRLVVNGDDGGATNDTIVLRKSAANADYLEVVVNGAIQYAGLIQSVNQIELNGQAGNNAIVVQNAFSGIDITVNGGTTGRNLMIAGASAATLIGGAGEDILIGGTTSWDNNAGAIAAIMAEWSRTDLSYRQRMVHIVRGGGYNGTFVLNPNTVDGNGQANLLYGYSGRDLFFFDPYDVNDLDGSIGEGSFPI